MKAEWTVTKAESVTEQKMGWKEKTLGSNAKTQYFGAS